MNNIDEKELNMLLKEKSKEELAKELIKMKEVICKLTVSIEGIKRATLFPIYKEMDELEKRFNYDYNSKRTYNVLKHIDSYIRGL